MQMTEPRIPTLARTDFHFPRQTGVYHGKVRDVYTISDKYLVMIASDRISAFDVILPRPIPCKGQVLNLVAVKMIASVNDILPNWVINTPDPNVTIGKKCQPFKVEMVIRGYLTGHAWREYSTGQRLICGVSLPDGMKENEKFPEPIITPTTKASEGHDEDISREEIIKRAIVPEKDYIQLEEYTRSVYRRGSELAAKRGLILVDTKYEFGMAEGKIHLMDEIHTPDSSRYFYADSYEERFKKGQPQRQLSKEFVRQWLIDNNFQGKENQTIPEMSDAWIDQISSRYIELYEVLTGEKFIKPSGDNLHSRIEKNVLNALSALA